MPGDFPGWGDCVVVHLAVTFSWFGWVARVSNLEMLFIRRLLVAASVGIFSCFGWVLGRVCRLPLRRFQLLRLGAWIGLRLGKARRLGNVIVGFGD